MDMSPGDRTVTKIRRFSKIELRHIAVSILVLSLAFMLMFRDYEPVVMMFRYYLGNLWIVGLFALMVGITFFSFFLHEMGHKFTAQDLGLWSEYRMFPMGLVICLVSGLAGFLFAAPGVVYINGWVTQEQDGKISLAGPAVNILLSMFGLAGCLIFNGSPMVVPCYLVFSLNASLALFNMLPIGILDGSKILKWSPAAWVAAFAISAFLFVYRFLDIFPALYYSL